MRKFSGFSKQLPDFWFDLHFNNNTESEAELKDQYKKYIINPLANLYEALVPTVLDIWENIELSPSRCISSPYTDRRFSRGVPFKELFSQNTVKQKKLLYWKKGRRELFDLYERFSR